MAETEGVVKYRLHHEPGSPLDASDLADLIRWHAQCWDLGVVGRDPRRYGGYAFGNISVRQGSGFIISGTQTGGREQLTAADYARILECDPGDNQVRSQGPAKPSSETLTHGEIYAAQPHIQAIIHGHAPVLWSQARDLGLPITAPDAACGTPEMAAEVRRIVQALGADGLLIMGGHEDGVIAYGKDLDATGARFWEALEKAKATA